MQYVKATRKKCIEKENGGVTFSIIDNYAHFGGKYDLLYQNLTYQILHIKEIKEKNRLSYELKVNCIFSIKK